MGAQQSDREISVSKTGSKIAERKTVIKAALIWSREVETLSLWWEQKIKADGKIHYALLYSQASLLISFFFLYLFRELLAGKKAEIHGLH